MNDERDQAVLCIVDDDMKALRIVESLRAAGFREGDISLIVPHKHAHGDIEIEGHTKAPEGATAGVAGGMLLGGTLGWMAGIGALAIPGLGPFIAAGPIMAALGGAAIGSAAGGVTGGLIGMGFSEYEAKQYESYLREGNSLISVRAADNDEIARAKSIFRDAEASHVSVQSVVRADRRT